jgi:hypothetical protein
MELQTAYPARLLQVAVDKELLAQQGDQIRQGPTVARLPQLASRERPAHIPDEERTATAEKKYCIFGSRRNLLSFKLVLVTEPNSK